MKPVDSGTWRGQIKAALKVANPYIPPDCAHLMDKGQREAVDHIIRELVASQF